MATDPNNAEVLLSLGVSYTNELDQGRALNFLTAWLSRQPAFTKVGPGLLTLTCSGHHLQRQLRGLHECEARTGNCVLPSGCSVASPRLFPPCGVVLIYSQQGNPCPASVRAFVRPKMQFTGVGDVSFAARWCRVPHVVPPPALLGAEHCFSSRHRRL